MNRLKAPPGDLLEKVHKIKKGDQDEKSKKRTFDFSMVCSCPSELFSSG
jgi:hypothetical protein